MSLRSGAQLRARWARQASAVGRAPAAGAAVEPPSVPAAEDKPRPTPRLTFAPPVAPKAERVNRNVVARPAVIPHGQLVEFTALGGAVGWLTMTIAGVPCLTCDWREAADFTAWSSTELALAANRWGMPWRIVETPSLARTA